MSAILLATRTSKTPATKVDTEKTEEFLPHVHDTLRHTELADLKLPRKLEPIEEFRKQVYETWLPKWDETIDGVSSTIWFENAEQDGAVQLKEYTPAELRTLRELDQIHWKEEYHYEQVLKNIQLPFDPARPFSRRGEGPVIFVKNQDVVIVVNGNHRAGAVMLEEYNRTHSPLYVVEFSSIDAYEKFADCPLTSRSYLDISVEPGGRRRP
jgi:hypothetical protein